MRELYPPTERFDPTGRLGREFRFAHYKYTTLDEVKRRVNEPIIDTYKPKDYYDNERQRLNLNGYKKLITYVNHPKYTSQKS